MSKAIIMGRLTGEPEGLDFIGESPMTVARFTLAVNKVMKKKKNQKMPDFLRCVAFGKTGEQVKKCATKGTRLVLEGDIKTDSHIEDGKEVNTTIFNVNHCKEEDANE